MTRILCWNIDNFDLLKIENPDSMNYLGGYLVPEWQASRDCSNYILANLDITAPGTGAVVRPDIIVVIEVSTEDTYDANPGIGRLATGVGGQGAAELLNRIRVATGNANWMIVPPLQTGPREAVAVYYDSTNYCFAGPWIWPGGNGPSQAAGGSANYPQPFDVVLPNRNIPAGLPNAAVSERQVAAATGFTYRVGHQQAGQAFPIANNRRTPYQVTLGQVDYTQNPPVVQRTLSLFAIHGPAGNNPARNYLTALADVEEIVAAPALNEVKVVLGDFNLNLTNEEQGPPTQIVQAQQYQYLINAGYELSFSSPNPVPSGGQGPFTGYRGYLATHVRTLNQATYRYIGNNADYYPGYGVIGDGISATKNYSLDNILVKFGDNGHGAPCGALDHVTILNGVVPPPFNVVLPPLPPALPPPYVGPPGYYQWPLQMTNVAPYNAPPAQQQQPVNPADQASLPQWNNYGHIRCTSDHMAIVADV